MSQSTDSMCGLPLFLVLVPIKLCVCRFRLTLQQVKCLCCCCCCGMLGPTAVPKCTTIGYVFPGNLIFVAGPVSPTRHCDLSGGTAPSHRLVHPLDDSDCNSWVKYVQPRLSYCWSSVKLTSCSVWRSLVWPALWLTYISSPPNMYTHSTDCYSQYRALHERCRRKLSALALLQPGTHCRIMYVDLPSFWALVSVTFKNELFDIAYSKREHSAYNLWHYARLIRLRPRSFLHPPQGVNSSTTFVLHPWLPLLITS